MNLRALQAFNAVLATGSVSGAARHMNLSQPAVSRQIALLEAELNLTLFKRERRRLALTEQGQAFARESRRILASLQEIPRIADEIRQGRLQRLRIVTMPRTAMSIVAPAVARFSRQAPGVEISLDMRGHRDMEAWINGREYDLGFGNVPISHRAAVGTPLARAALELVVPAAHALSGEARVPLEALTGETLVNQFPGMLLRNQVDALLETRQVKVAREVLTNSSQMQQHLVANGAGVAIIDRLSTLTMGPDQLVSVPLEPTQWVVFGTIQHRETEPDPILGSLIAALRAQVERHARAGSIELV
ncbi:LysR family transcriptional regulator [Poseidonocella sp. HB161398]|uniref:LysR family transcriptional regulator n=1 Tax=Poseidonocella sp. HB161398 TaxID=2320855 RepID=UPI0011094D79|nr:LysR family transcriptional regulator [Poseidonocella sp. HB161398]